MLYFADSAVSPRLHGGHVEHEEVEISDDELRRIKHRARRAVTMDQSRPNYRHRPSAFNDFLAGNHRR